MKKLATSFLLLSLMATSAYAVTTPWGSYLGRDYYGRATCAPEVVNGNLAATERVLREVTAHADFNDATLLKSNIEKIAKLESNQAKFEAYMELVSVNSANVDDVVNFVGARDLDPYAVSVEKKLALNKAQSEIIVTTLVTALKGNQ